MKTLIIYENLSSGGIANVIRRRLLDKVYTDVTLYFLHDLGGWHLFEELDDIELIVGHVGHEMNIRELIVEKRVRRLILFSHFHLIDVVGDMVDEIIVEYHRSDERSLYTLRKFVPTDTRIIVPSEWSKAFVRAVWNGELVVRPNDIDDRVFFRGQDKRPTDPPEYICVTQMGFHKGLTFCVQGFRRYVDTCGPRKLTIVVSQEPKPESALEILKLIDRCGLRECVTVIWSISQGELGDLFRRCAETDGANIVASWRESFGLVVIEAQACGLHSIVPKVGALPEIIDKSDVVYRHGDVEDLARVFVEWEKAA